MRSPSAAIVVPLSLQAVRAHGQPAPSEIHLTLEIATDTFLSGETFVKLLPFVLAAVLVALTVALANSTATPTVSGAAGGLHSAELMRLSERNRRFDVNGAGCNTPLGEFDLRCVLAQRHVAQEAD
jgi:hypothetical protein